MIKRIIATSILIFFIGFPIVICTTNQKQKKIEVMEFPYSPVEVQVLNINIEETQTEIESEEDIYTQKCNELLEKQEELSAITDKKDWFIGYKNLINEYSEWCDSPESIYDYYTDDELDLMFRVVQAEIGDEYTFEQKCNVASVILNRLDAENFANEMNEILVSSQFQTISNGRYMKVEVSDDTILACEYAFMIEDTTGGCLFFDSNNALRYEFVFNDGAHNFYK